MPFTRTAALYTVPDLTLGLTNAQGSSDGIRADASIAIYTTDNPTTAAASDSPTPGTAATASRSDHLHGMPASFTTFEAPNLTLGTANAIGSGDSIRSGATLLAFDATVPTTVGVGDSAAAGTATVTARRDHQHGSSAFAVVDEQLFTADGTWTKPAGVTVCYMALYGGGGGGSRGESAGGAGGGGGAFNSGMFDASALPATLTVTIGTGGAAGTSAGGLVGGSGLDTTVSGTDFNIQAFGGNGGARPNGADNGGGSGGGTGGRGVVGNTTAAVIGGDPIAQGITAGDNVGGGGGGGGFGSTAPGNAENGGGGGAGGRSGTSIGNDGGSSLHGGGGGGAGGRSNDGGAGGSWGVYTVGGGGSGGTTGSADGGNGDSRTFGAGDGGGGGATGGGAGGDGGSPGGAGGGGGFTPNADGGQGADGAARVWSW